MNAITGLATYMIKDFRCGGGETAITLFEAYSFSTPCGFSVHFAPENTHKVFESLTPSSQEGSPPQFFTVFQNCGGGEI
jgi:hypothetical protein